MSSTKEKFMMSWCLLLNALINLTINFSSSIKNSFEACELLRDFYLVDAVDFEKNFQNPKT